MNIPRKFKLWRYPLLLKFRYWLESILCKDTVCVKYWISANIYAWTGKIRPYNWGDYMNLILAGFISHKKVIPQQIYDAGHSIAMVGSILPWAMDKHTIIWGSGCLDSNDEGWQFVEKPFKVCAVRGPLTREILLKHGIECPEIYGDPMLCLPRFYYPRFEKTTKIVIIPHVSCINKAYELCAEYPAQVTILNPGTFDTWNEFVDTIASARFVFSASLHGLIVADAYGVPNTWITFPGHTHPDNNFKFHDYFASVNKECNQPVRIEDIDFSLIDKYVEEWFPPQINIDKLLASCPLC